VLPVPWLLALFTEASTHPDTDARSFKGALARETARRRSSVYDLAAGILAEEFGIE
jgi:hypothetical protein